jgi:hypothetical protein
MQLMQSTRSSRGNRRKKRLVIWILALVLVGGGFLIKDDAMSHYLRWKQRHALAQARAFIAKRDAPSAQLALDVALKAVPGNVETLRVAADMLDQVGAPQAMRLRRMVTQLVPNSAEDAAKFIFCCLRFSDYNAAKDGLAQTSPEVSAQLPMLQAALAYATATSDSAVADALIQELRRRLPDDEELSFMHAILHLRHPDAAMRDKAKVELTEFARLHPQRRLVINRALVAAATQQGDYAEARSRINAVLADPQSTLNDRLQRANIELLVDHLTFEKVYAEISPLASANEEDSIQFIRWLLVQKRTSEAGSWLASLPASYRNNRAVRSMEADIVSQSGDWNRLASLLEAGAWGDIPSDCIRLAMSARLIEGQGNKALRLDVWNAAIEGARTNLAALRVLHRLAVGWSWDKEVESTLWTIARSFPDQTWAHQALFNIFKAEGKTASMRDVLALLRQANPGVGRYQGDWALLVLLTEGGLSWTPAKETMRELHDSHPGNPIYASGYAYALALSDRGDEALALLETMSVADREYPPRIPYTAFVYGMARNPAEVERLQELARKSGASYLPEERMLFSQAREASRRPLPPPKIKRAGALPAEPATPAP